MVLQTASAQIDPDQRVGKKLSKLMKSADDALNAKNFTKAKRLYLEALEIKPDYCAPKRALSGICYIENDYGQAISYLEKVVEECPFMSRIMYYELGQFYYRHGDYDKATDNFQKFKKYLELPRTKFGPNGFMEDQQNWEYAMIVDESIFQATYARDSIPALEIEKIENLGDSINTSINDYFPFMTNDGNVLLFTRMLNPTVDEDFFVSYMGDDGKWSKGKRVGNRFNTNGNEGMCTCTRDNIRMYFTACQRSNVKGTCDIQQAILEVTDTVKVVSVEPIKGELNSNWWESQANISCDGRMMFFTSSRLGGYGKTDIYVSYIQPDGSWGKPENLGPNINTYDYEESAFITNDGKTLFFSSTGMLGMGEQDIYMSRIQPDGTWGKAVNLGNKVNTSYREIGFFLTADGQTGYFASNRPGGEGNLDIYRFTLSEPVKSDPITFVEGYVRDSVTKEPVQTVLEVADGQKIGTDENGRFFRCLPPGAFPFNINESPYLPYERVEMIPEWHNRSFYQMEMLLQKEAFKSEPIVEVPKEKPKPTPIPEKKEMRSIPKPDLGLTIYFDFDQSVIRPSESSKLSQLITQLKKETSYQIELKAYCDFKGSNQYNIHLSDRRAESTLAYLLSNGIPRDRITYEGLGEINDDNPRWMNRRVDVVIKRY